MNICVSLYHEEQNKLETMCNPSQLTEKKLFFILNFSTEPLLLCSNLQKITMRAM